MRTKFCEWCGKELNPDDYYRSIFNRIKTCSKECAAKFRGHKNKCRVTNENPQSTWNIALSNEWARRAL